MRTGFGLSLTLIGVLVGGCTNVTEFSVVRPAMLGSRLPGATIAIASIAEPSGGHVAADLASALSNRVAHTASAAIHLAPADTAALIVTGSIQSNDYTEHYADSQGTCSRIVESGRSGQSGGAPDRTESYPCIQRHRVGTAVSRIQLALVDRRTGAPIFTRVYDRTDHRDVPAPPGATAQSINGEAMLRDLRARTVEQFARVFLPARETPRIRFEHCRGDERCARAVDMIQHADLTGAESLFTAVIGAHDGATQPVSRDAIERVSDALYDRSVARAYLGNYDGAAADLARAMSLRPEMARWRQDAAGLRELSADLAALREQQRVSSSSPVPTASPLPTELPALAVESSRSP